MLDEVVTTATILPITSHYFHLPFSTDWNFNSRSLTRSWYNLYNVAKYHIFQNCICTFVMFGLTHDKKFTNISFKSEKYFSRQFMSSRYSVRLFSSSSSSSETDKRVVEVGTELCQCKSHAIVTFGFFF